MKFLLLLLVLLEVIGTFLVEVTEETPGLYLVPELRNFIYIYIYPMGGSGGGPRENPMSLSSPRAEILS